MAPPTTPRHRRAPNDRVLRINVQRRGPDLYHTALTATWPKFLLAACGWYLALNIVFALLYMLQLGAVSNAHPGSFWDAFFFSVETLATIGYGVMAPNTIYAGLVVTIEALVGIFSTAILTGLLFARFSRPTARVLFSRTAVIAPFQGTPTLMIRLANERRSHILAAAVVLTMIRNEITTDGEEIRRLVDLPLLRDHSPIFALSFTIMHPITPDSPLFGASAESLAAQEAEFMLNVSGTDEVLLQTVHARTSYGVADLRWGHRYVDVLGYTPEGRRAIDYSRFHDTEEPTETA